MSFTRPLCAARRTVRTGIGTGVQAISAALKATIAEIGGGLLPERRLRAPARVVKRKPSSSNVKRTKHRNWPRPTKPAGQGIRVLAPPYLNGSGA